MKSLAGVGVLEKMCNNPPNKTALRAFIDLKKGTVTTDDERLVIAKTCASPPFGGFAGPNPAQRSDDPHDGTETTRPLSSHVSWWETLQNLGTIALGAFGLHQMPAPNTNVPAEVHLRMYACCVLATLALETALLGSKSTLPK